MATDQRSSARSMFPVAGCVMALAMVAGAVIVRLLLDPVAGERYAYGTVLLTVLFVATYLGLGPALVALVFGGIAVTYFVLPPRGSWSFGMGPHIGGQLLYVLTSVVLVAVGGALRNARASARRADQDVRGQAAALLERENQLRLSAEHHRQSEERYHAIFEHAPYGIQISDAEARLLDVNPAMCRLLGYTRDELIGLPVSQLGPPGRVEAALHDLKTLGSFRREAQVRRKDGSWFAAEIVAATMPNGQLLGMLADLTERTRAIEDLRQAEERMRFAFEGARIGLWDIDYRSGVVQWSPMLEAHYGLQPGTFEGTLDAFMKRVHPDDRAPLLETVNRAMTADPPEFSEKHRALWDDGTVRWVEGMGRLYLDADGALVRAVGIELDVTERHMLEAQYQQAQKMEAIGRLAGGVAHDFNNLLTAILGHCELLQADLGPGDARYGEVAEIQAAAARAAALTRQLLAFSRKQIIEPTLLDLNTVVTDIRSMLGRLIRENIRIVLNLQPGLLCVKADRGQLDQLIVNLVVNARDAMLEGGTLTVATADVTVDATYSATHLEAVPGEYVVLTVSDTGTGMTPEVQAQLFEPFFTTKEVGQGTGLGLATVHGVVKRSAGFINVYSEVGHGTSIKVYLPRLVDSDAPSAPLPAASGPLTGSETVLVVEDSDGLRMLTRRLLERQGYTVLTAGSADEAIEIFEGPSVIDVLLTDVVMPGASGPALTKRLTARRPDLKVIYMSGYTEDAIVNQGVLKPGIAFLHKPFSSETLGRKVREVLEQRSAIDPA